SSRAAPNPLQSRCLALPRTARPLQSTSLDGEEDLEHLETGVDPLSPEWAPAGAGSVPTVRRCAPGAPRGAEIGPPPPRPGRSELGGGLPGAADQRSHPAGAPLPGPLDRSSGSTSRPASRRLTGVPSDACLHLGGGVVLEHRETGLFAAQG